MPMILVLVTACAQVPLDPDARVDYQRNNDPAEPTNRVIFGANQAVDRTVLKPVSKAYKDHLPNGVRRGVHNFASNLGEPRILVNDLLQGNFRHAWTTTQRFAVNSTAGGAGFFDLAGNDLGLPRHDADFGQTFGVWGIGPGPVVELPLLGASNVRDTAGAVFGFVADPLGQIPGSTITTITAVGAGGELLGIRSSLLTTTNELEKNSLDYYATLRSISAQRRAAAVQEGKTGGRLSQVGDTGLSPGPATGILD